MLHPSSHGGLLRLTSNRQFESFNACWCDGRTGRLVAQRRRALIDYGTPVEGGILGLPQRYSCTTHPYVSSGWELKHRASLTVLRRGGWASTAVKCRYKTSGLVTPLLKS